MADYERIRVTPFGDSGVLIQWPAQINQETSSQVHSCYSALKQADLPGVFELVVAYASIAILFNPLVIDYEKIAVLLADVLRQDYSWEEVKQSSVVREIPVYYGDKWGPDLAEVARYTGLTEAEVIRRHADSVYQVAMLGFLPGFPYLMGMDKSLVTPRKTQPRVQVNSGSVGIAGEQTGIYSLASPGGWQIIGWTPAKLFDPGEVNPFYLRPGDSVKFVAVTK